ncbi:hypothetical protein BCR34DRAFT_595528 [Clohesyomyces aquaticus]|uniref:Uncharacterized protein n=1 Tax=Clohesyomyces aquaticus TaxID=1231657 RepID=A0A1Y2AAQ9_9PLEO|nr:hypothetical protein BCR34DRAFT_595528 [Clohesyomyces aquaticus]
MEHEGSTSPSWSPISRLSVSREPSNPPHPQLSGLTLPLPGIRDMTSNQPRRRYPGDGLDYRRPITLSRNDGMPPLIDLTQEEAGPSTSNNGRSAARAQRPPRFPREIIDIEDDVDFGQPVPDSPEIEFISARTIDPPRRLPPPPRQERPESIEDDDDDDVEITGVQALPGADRGLRRHEMRDVDNIMHHFLNDLEHTRAEFGRYAAQVVGQAAEMMGRARNPAVPPRAGGVRRRGDNIHIHVGFLPPNLDFDRVGFEMGMGGGPPPPPPTYDAPPPAAKGFTRSPAEDDVLICPNCEDELCAGDSDEKRQVWIVKKCGHVYCGECTLHRTKAKAKAKGKEKAGSPPIKPFATCVVEGCEEKTNRKTAMIQIFL